MWMVIAGVVVVSLLVLFGGWFVMYSLFDWGVSKAKQIWKDED